MGKKIGWKSRILIRHRKEDTSMTRLNGDFRWTQHRYGENWASVSGPVKLGTGTILRTLCQICTWDQIQTSCSSITTLCGRNFYLCVSDHIPEVWKAEATRPQTHLVLSSQHGGLCATVQHPPPTPLNHHTQLCTSYASCLRGAQAQRFMTLVKGSPQGPSSQTKTG